MGIDVPLFLFLFLDFPCLSSVDEQERCFVVLKLFVLDEFWKRGFYSVLVNLGVTREALR